jgi:hypothetical protein
MRGSSIGMNCSNSSARGLEIRALVVALTESERELACVLMVPPLL